MSKPCRNCGAELPDGASFCPHCTTVQTEKQQIKPLRRWRKRLVSGLAAVLILAAVGVAALLLHRPETYEGGAEVTYTDQDGTYHVLLAFTSMDGVMKTAEPEAASSLPEGVESIYPSQLYVYREDTEELVWGEFLEKVDTCLVETTPLSGGTAMTASAPAHQEDLPYAALVSNVLYSAASGSNEVLWTLKMKNGDTILLRQRIDASAQATVSYSPETTPMNTAGELQALLDTIAAEVSTDTMVELFLPPVAYDGPILFSGHTFRLYGGSDGAQQTTFTGPVTLRSVNPQFSEIFDICFSGSGGTGLTAHSAVVLHGCTVTGWDTGAFAEDGSWVGADGCRFEDNGVGLEFNNPNYACSTSTFPDNTFAGNETAVRVRNLGGMQTLDFVGCAFSQNGTDVENLTDHPVDLSGAKLD